MSRNDDRRNRILDLIAGPGYESVGALAQALAVSEMTIRRDLDHLEARGLIRRTHGGAVAEQVPELSIDFRVRSRQHAQAKARVAQAACERIADGQVVYLDAGTTVLAMAEGLAPRRDLTVVTPSLPLANALARHDGIAVILLGGEFRPDLLSVIGPIAEQTLSSFHLDVAVLGTGGFHPGRGLTHSTLEEVPLKRLAARLADRVVVVATREKVGRSGVIYFLGRDEIDEALIGDERGVERVAGRDRITPAGGGRGRG